MRQTSEQFMDEMLKDNTPTQSGQGTDLADQIAKTIDEKLEKAMAKFTEQFAKVSEPTGPTEPAEGETPEETIDTPAQQGEPTTEEGE